VVAVEPAAGGCSSDEVGRWFGSVDYLLFWQRRDPSPPLVQILPTSLANFEANGGNLPPNAAATVFGAHGTDPGDFSGVRVFLGAYLDDAKCWGVDGSYLQLFQKSDSFAISSAGVPVIGRGFFDVASGKDAFLRYSTPDGSTTGFIRADAPVEMYTFDANIRAQGPSFLSDRVDYLGGFRYLNLRDSNTIDSGATISSPTGGPPFAITSHENFKATNQFYGGQFGVETHYRYGCFTLNFTAKAATGWVKQEVHIDGFSTTQVGAAPVQTFPNQSILYVQPTNAGSFSRNIFAVLPEFMVNLGYQITPHLRATIGYDYLDVTSVQRSGAAIDPQINSSLTKFVLTQQTSTIRRPVFNFSGTDYWAQGLMLGLAYSY
jgi:hypothetical protein